MEVSKVQISHELNRTINDLGRALFEEFGKGCQYTIATPDGKLIASNYLVPFALVMCRKCGVTTNTTPRQKYCGDGSDKDNSHDWKYIDPRELQC